MKATGPPLNNRGCSPSQPRSPSTAGRKADKSTRVARYDDEQERKKVSERGLVDSFLRDFGSDGVGWTCVEPDREKPDFVYERLGHCVGIEITELLSTDSGRERAGERHLADIICTVVAQVVREHGGRGAVVDAHLLTLPR